MLTLLLPILMQVGPNPSGGLSPIEQLDMNNRPPRTRANRDAQERTPSALETCLDTARTAPEKAHAISVEWIKRTTGEQRAAGEHCLGVAAGNMGEWDAARAAFIAARADAEDAAFRTRMSALAGSAALASGDAAGALALLDAAKSEDPLDPSVRGAIALDRASALVALDRADDATSALAEARAAMPGDPQAWLLSATLARRTGDLATAQAQIEKAVSLDPQDPAIGLEAGVIAILAGHSEAARKSWQSVMETAPDSEQAQTAKDYLAQIGEGAQ
ncbi:hypothetical protein D6858_14835 [Tsuneonella suprasediminis]|uniref:Uncharacterized protein n=1 Tax=Tsuneonella suprasediminis TaxID=2306996 RepID=A0A419QY16_9SPHN|nr:tetratricopeptide repeat protein [Tsuneonella suprasediminis]RJX65581.1 hypothetical protein D6858_14835 [Tsuneonella suprasediminis]